MLGRFANGFGAVALAHLLANDGRAAPRGRTTPRLALPAGVAIVLPLPAESPLPVRRPEVSVVRFGRVPALVLLLVCSYSRAQQPAPPARELPKPRVAPDPAPSKHLW